MSWHCTGVLASLSGAGRTRLACLLFTGCVGSLTCATGCGGSDTAHANGGFTNGDATAGNNGNGLDGSGDAPDWSTFCTGPLPDAGFSSLADLPIARLCAASFDDEVSESKPSCQGWRLVSAASGVDCGGWWLFDDATGALAAVGGGCNTDLACTGAVPGFQFPYQCFVNSGWTPTVDLCPDASPGDGGIADASTDGGD